MLIAAPAAFILSLQGEVSLATHQSQGVALG